MEIYWRDNFTCPTEEEYEIMTKRSNIFAMIINVSRNYFFFRNWWFIYVSYKINAII